MDTAQLIQAVKEKTGAETDYRVAVLMGTAPTVVANWTHGRRVISDEYALIAARLADLPEDYVLISIAAERTQGKARDVLRRAAAGLLSAALSVLLVVGTFTGYPAIAGFPGHCILCKTVRRRLFALCKSGAQRRCSMQFFPA